MAGLTEQEVLGALDMIGYRDSSEVKTADWASFFRAAQDSLIKEHTGMFSLAHGCVQKAVSVILTFSKANKKGSVASKGLESIKEANGSGIKAVQTIMYRIQRFNQISKYQI